MLTTMTFRTAAAVVAVAAVAVVPLGASDPIGVYAVVQKVVLEPSDAQPQRIQVWGAFALADTQSPDDYATPQVGYVYYSCPQGQEQLCRNEWADIKSVAGSGTAVGFGARRMASGKIHKADEKPGTPDVYPIKMGVTKVTAQNQPSVVARLKAALTAR